MNNCLSQKLRALYNSGRLPWIIIGLGIILRIIRYLHNPAFGFDESSNAVDIISRSFVELFGPSSDESIKYPYGFMVLERLAVLVFGNGEYALRLPPLLLGILSPILFYKLIQNNIKPYAVLVALGLFAILEPLIMQSSNVKPYMGDLTFALMIVIWADYIKTRSLNVANVVLAGFAGAVIIWFSYPSLFVLAGVGVCLAAFCLSNKEWSRLGKLVIVYLMWAASFLACYFMYIQKLISNFDVSMEEMLMMEQAFMPFPPQSLNDIKWIMDSFFQMFSNPLGLTFTGLAAVAFLVGFISLYRNNKRNLLLFISPLLVTLLASVLHQYPSKGRLIIFLIPFILLFISEGIEYIRKRISVHSASPGLILLGVIFIYPFLWSAYHTVNPNSPENVKPALHYIKDNWQEGDMLYVHYYPQYILEYYSEFHPEPITFDKENIVIGIAPRGWYRHWRKEHVSRYYGSDTYFKQTNTEILNEYIKDLNKLKGLKRVWVLFSSVIMKGGIQEEQFYVFHLDKIGNRLDKFGRSGVVNVYLYDLSNQPSNSSSQ